MCITHALPASLRNQESPSPSRGADYGKAIFSEFVRFLVSVKFPFGQPWRFIVTLQQLSSPTY